MKQYLHYRTSTSGAIKQAVSSLKRTLSNKLSRKKTAEASSHPIRHSTTQIESESREHARDKLENEISINTKIIDNLEFKCIGLPPRHIQSSQNNREGDISKLSQLLTLDRAFRNCILLNTDAKTREYLNTVSDEKAVQTLANMIYDDQKDEFKSLTPFQNVIMHYTTVRIQEAWSRYLEDAKTAMSIPWKGETVEIDQEDFIILAAGQNLGSVEGIGIRSNIPISMTTMGHIPTLQREDLVNCCEDLGIENTADLTAFNEKIFYHLCNRADITPMLPFLFPQMKEKERIKSLPTQEQPVSTTIEEEESLDVLVEHTRHSIASPEHTKGYYPEHIIQSPRVSTTLESAPTSQNDINILAAEVRTENPTKRLIMEDQLHASDTTVSEVMVPTPELSDRPQRDLSTQELIINLSAIEKSSREAIDSVQDKDKRASFETKLDENNVSRTSTRDDNVIDSTSAVPIAVQLNTSTPENMSPPKLSSNISPISESAGVGENNTSTSYDSLLEPSSPTFRSSEQSASTSPLNLQLSSSSEECQSRNKNVDRNTNLASQEIHVHGRNPTIPQMTPQGGK